MIRRATVIASRKNQRDPSEKIKPNKHELRRTYTVSKDFGGQKN